MGRGLTGVRIRVTTAGLLGEYLPAGDRPDEASLDVDAGTTVIDVLRRLGMPLEDQYLIALNDTVVPRDERGDTTLADGDELSIMPPLRGG